MLRRNSTRISKRQEKIYNICGEMVLVYSVIDNAPLCEDCVPIKKQKKIMGESAMIDKILRK